MKAIRIVVQATALTVGAAGACSAQETYHLGEGLAVGNANVAGYSNVVLEVPRDGTHHLAVDDLSLFVSGRFDRYLNPFLEVELDEVVLAAEGGDAGSGDWVVERIYDDVSITPATTLRIGKMLAPVGDWNITHAAPLVWTTNRPLTTYYPFSEFASGLAVNYLGASNGWDAQVYVQPGDEWIPQSGAGRRNYHHVGGFNLRHSWNIQNRLGLALQSARDADSGEKQIALAAYGTWTSGPLLWDAQVDYVTIDGPGNRLRDRESGFYIEAVYPIDEQWYAVVQGERFEARDVAPDATKRLFGVVYRPQPAVSWKLEYLDATGAALGMPTGVYASWAVLF